jgi:hypothetical protein
VTADQVLADYLIAVRTVRASGAGTDERSFYPALNQFLSGLGGLISPKLGALSDPAAIEASFPDVAIYELSSQVLVLPIEVKPASWDIDTLLASEQPLRYAKLFGGGMVMCCNLRSFVLAQLDQSGQVLVELGRYTLLNAESDFDTAHPAIVEPASALLGLIETGSATTHHTLDNPRTVARLLAWHARQLAGSIASTAEPEKLLAPIIDAFKQGLEIDLDDEYIVPTIVQTLSYGIFAAWLQQPDTQSFDWRSAAYRLDVPLFADVLYACLRPALIRECDLFPRLDAMAHVLEWVDKEAFAEQFGGRAIEYFYEPFLAEFDPDLRNLLGVWYTPRAIADYQVARVDDLLRTELGVADGIADESVLILDPASGTGTYLTAVLDAIHKRHLDNHQPAELAAAKTREAAIGRVIGFEILPAAFIISHLHLSRHLNELGAPLGSDDRLRIYLTNSLIGWSADFNPPSFTLFPDLVEEITAARKVKQHEPIIVVLGNPPYQGYSSAETTEEKEMMLPWISPLWPTWGIRKHRLNDLYVRFWRVALHRIVDLTDRGVISFISNRKWLGGRSYPTMRESVVRGFDSIVVDDLHGDYVHSGLGGGADESIFSTSVAGGIRVGTAIVSAVRTGPSADENHVSVVRGRDVYGTASEKRQALADWADGTVSINSNLEVRQTSQSVRWRLSGDPGGEFPPLDDYFNFALSGVQTIRDEAVVDKSKTAVHGRMLDYFDSDVDWATIAARYPGFAVNKSGYNGPKVRSTLLNASTLHDERFVRFLFKPYDVRWLYWEPQGSLLNRARPELMPYFIGMSEQWAIIAPQTRNRPGSARPIATKAVPSFKAAFQDARVFPLQSPGSVPGNVPGQLAMGGGANPESNVSKRWITSVRSLGVPGDDLELGAHVFHAILGISADVPHFSMIK